MKKYIVFSISFLISFVALQFIYGYVRTLFYTPDIESAWGQIESLSSSVIVRETSAFFPVLFIAFLAVTIAYFTPKLFLKKQQ